MSLLIFLLKSNRDKFGNSKRLQMNNIESKNTNFISWLPDRSIFIDLYVFSGSQVRSMFRCDDCCTSRAANCEGRVTTWLWDGRGVSLVWQWYQGPLWHHKRLISRIGSLFWGSKKEKLNFYLFLHLHKPPCTVWLCSPLTPPSDAVLRPPPPWQPPHWQPLVHNNPQVGKQEK